jgi:hypothetical protein
LRPWELPEAACKEYPGGQMCAEVGGAIENDTSITSRLPEGYNRNIFRHTPRIWVDKFSPKEALYMYVLNCYVSHHY